MSICGVSRRSAWRTWAVALSVLMVSLAFAGVSWGGTGTYDPAADPYSMANLTPQMGAQAWWNAGYTGQGVDVAADRHGRLAGPGAQRPGQGRLRPRPLARVADPESPQPRHERPRHVHGRPHRRPRLRPDRAVLERAGLRLSRHRPGRADRLAQGGDRRRRRRRDAGDRGDRLGRPARARPRLQHPRDQPLVRHELDAAVRESTRSRTRSSRRGSTGSSSSRRPATPATSAATARRALRPGLRPVRDRGRRRTTRWAPPKFNDDTWAPTRRARPAAERARTPTSSRPARTCRVSAIPDSYVDQNHPEGMISRPLLPRLGHLRGGGDHVRRDRADPPEVPDLTPDQVKRFIADNGQKVPGVDIPGAGRAARSTSPRSRGRHRRTYTQSFTDSTGTRLARALARHRPPQPERRGPHAANQDIFGNPFNPSRDGDRRGGRVELVGRRLERELVVRQQLVGLELERQLAGAAAAGRARAGAAARWSGNSWSGSSWSGSRWSGSSWSGDELVGRHLGRRRAGADGRRSIRREGAVEELSSAAPPRSGF